MITQAFSLDQPEIPTSRTSSGRLLNGTAYRFDSFDHTDLNNNGLGHKEEISDDGLVSPDQ
jgi:hypothetical protein